MNHRQACFNWSRVWFYFRFLFNDLFDRIMPAPRDLLKVASRKQQNPNPPSITCLHKSFGRLSEGLLYENDDQKPDIIVHLNQITIDRGRQIVWSHYNWIRFSNTNVSEHLPSEMKRAFSCTKVSLVQVIKEFSNKVEIFMLQQERASYNYIWVNWAALLRNKKHSIICWQIKLLSLCIPRYHQNPRASCNLLTRCACSKVQTLNVFMKLPESAP